MNTLTAQRHTDTVTDTDAYLAAVRAAERRALHSYFDQHVLSDDEQGYIAVDEGDYTALPMHLVERVVHTVHGGMLDEF